jgi:hypothetical protein
VKILRRAGFDKPTFALLPIDPVIGAGMDGAMYVAGLKSDVFHKVNFA